MYNGAGIFQLTSGNPVITGTLISSTWANNTLADIANNGLSNAITKDGQTTLTGNIPFGTFRITGLGDAVNLQDATTAKQIQNGGLVTLSSVAGTDLITASTTPGITAYVAGQAFRFVTAGANTGTAPTLNLNALGAKNIVKADNSALWPGDMPAGAMVQVVYDGTNFQLSGLYRQGRTRLVASTNFFVSNSGNDSNNGLTSGTAWATLQNAYTVLQNNYDLAGFRATINVAAGTYAAMTATGKITGALNEASVIFSGAAATVLTSSAPACFFATGGAQFTVSGFTVQNNNSGASGVGVLDAGTVILIGTGMAFAFCSGSHMLATGGATIKISATYAITNGAGVHYNANGFGTIGTTTSITVALSGTIGFPASFANASVNAVLSTTGITFTGLATGVKYVVSSNSTINVGGNPNYFPGSIAGTAASNGIYQ